MALKQSHTFQANKRNQRAGRPEAYNSGTYLLKGGETLEEIKLTIAMLCAKTKLSTEALADKAGIDRNHLAAVRAGRARMLADDVIALSDATGVDVRSIETKAEK